MQVYSNPDRENDPHMLPDVEVFELTAREAAELEEDAIWEFTQRHEFHLASMNSKVREEMLDAMIEENGIAGGWFWWTCLPGCLPDGSPFGPFATCDEAIADAQEGCK